jgi:hypothetical protein
MADTVEKVFWDEEQNFIGLLMRFMRDDVRDHVASQKNDHGASYRRYEASQPWRRPDFRLFQHYRRKAAIANYRRRLSADIVAKISLR